MGGELEAAGENTLVGRVLLRKAPLPEFGQSSCYLA